MKRLTSVLSFVLGATLSVGCGGEVDPGLEQEAGIGESSSTAAAETEAAPAATALPAYCNGVLTWNASWTAFEDEVLKLVNQKRAAGATCGGVAKPAVPALTFDERQRCAARVHSQDMGTNNFMSHTGSNGSTPWQRMTNAGYVWRSAAENVAAGQSTPAAVVNSWMNSSGHCNNIMGSGLKHLGVGYFYAPSSTYKHYWTQDFGAQ
ncbi:membrane protein [Cystobacter fuscus]|uniref:Membrane protein n=1 Tax=Cystobacter fuscus TaxID=43 RepID=A0A250JES0_9BACT|nr:CAP domain-containing protein [Cystobacter fuscus]ATB42090.1 membrane protein [Cystobacter fuscus]